MTRHNETINGLRESVLKLFGDAGYELPELLLVIDSQQKLIEENERLKIANKKLREMTSGKRESGSMSSRLKDALRE